jgi:glycosyltransferase involved in cell wall biosynthesis
VYFAHRQSAAEQGAAGFGLSFDWDVNLLDGYSHTFLDNCSRRPSVLSFSGCDTPDIGEKIARGGFRAVLVTGWFLKSYWQAIRACRRLGIPVMVRGDSHLATPRSHIKKVVKPVLHRCLVKQFDACLYVGERNREYLVHYGVPPGRLFFSPHFVDNCWFRERAQQSDRELVRRELGCDASDTIVLFSGKFIAAKRPLDLIEALAILAHGGIKLRGVFVGSGALEGAMRKLAADRGVPSVFTGFRNQSELPSLYAAADLLALPSDNETWGLVVNEAMACGTPAVVSDAAGCAPDMISPGETGTIFRTGDVSSLADAIAGSAGMRAQTSVQDALRRRTERYSVEAAAAGILDGAHSVLERVCHT